MPADIQKLYQHLLTVTPAYQVTVMTVVLTVLHLHTHQLQLMQQIYHQQWQLPVWLLAVHILFQQLAQQTGLV